MRLEIGGCGSLNDVLLAEGRHESAEVFEVCVYETNDKRFAMTREIEGQSAVPPLLGVVVFCASPGCLLVVHEVVENAVPDVVGFKGRWWNRTSKEREKKRARIDVDSAVGARDAGFEPNWKGGPEVGFGIAAHVERAGGSFIFNYVDGPNLEYRGKRRVSTFISKSVRRVFIARRIHSRIEIVVNSEFGIIGHRGHAEVQARRRDDCNDLVKAITGWHVVEAVHGDGKAMVGIVR